MVVATVSGGFVLDDGTGALFINKALVSPYVLGDYISATVTVGTYYSIWQGTAISSVAKVEGTAPSLKTPTAVTSAMVENWKTLGGSSSETTAPVATADVVPLTFTATAKVDSSNHTYFNVDGSTLSIQPSRLSTDIAIRTGVKYELVFYFGGYNSTNSYASIYVKSATPKYDAVTGVTISGPSAVMAGESIQLSAIIAPTSADDAVTWSTSDSAIAAVSSTGEVQGVAVGSANITATSTADSTKSATVAISVTANTLKSQAAFDLSKIPAVTTSATVSGALDDAGVLALFTGATYLTSGTNTITAATTTKLYQNDPSQGPLKTGLKFGSSKATGKLVLTSSVDLVKVKVSLYAWSAKDLATVTINGTSADLQAADVTTARTLSASFTASKTITIEAGLRVVVVGIEFFVSTI